LQSTPVDFAHQALSNGQMVNGCCESSPRFRRTLWIALAVNAGMFAVEFGAAWRAESVSLLADAIDFFGDAGNYAISLFVLGLAAIWRSRSAFGKGVIMGLYGLFVLGQALWTLLQGVVPNAIMMGGIGFLALIANVSVALVLFAFREGDANMRSVWLCSRNDAIGNAAVMLAAVGVFGTGTAWPDLAVAVVMSALALTAAVSVIRQSAAEMRQPKNAAQRQAS
jgi:Co/Zn/Cd efflux system component